MSLIETAWLSDPGCSRQTQFGRLASCVLAISLIITPDVAADDSKEASVALAKGGHVASIRHGNAPPGYGGDPPGFRIDDCKTQRNLDELGRRQARALGEAFRSGGVRVDRIVSSPVCRCLETADLMAVGTVEKSWALLPDTVPSVPVRLLELKEMVSAWRGSGTLVLVTHAFTVQGADGKILPDQAETTVPSNRGPEAGRAPFLSAGSRRPDRESVHLLSDHVKAAHAAGWSLLEMDEGLVDDAWLQKKPKLQIYSGLPISFSMVWRHR